MRSDPLGAFCAGEVSLAGAPAGPLAGLTFAAKDLFDIAGHVTGAGNPDWLASHAPAPRTAPVVQRLVDAGASMAGKTHTDELSRGIFGENAHYGTPVNPKAPDRVPGGSSSGSAAAVAGGLVDFALGTDTGGSVRVPASFCGLYGIRPTHGRLPFDGVIPQAPSFDTIGWFAREPALLARIATVLLGIEPARTLPHRLVVAEDAFAVAEPATREALKPAVDKLGRLIGRMDSAGCHRRRWRTGARTRAPSRAAKPGRHSANGSTATTRASASRWPTISCAARASRMPPSKPPRRSALRGAPSSINRMMRRSSAFPRRRFRRRCAACRAR